MFGVNIVTRQRIKAVVQTRLAKISHHHSKPNANTISRGRQQNDLRKWAFEGILPEDPNKDTSNEQL